MTDRRVINERRGTWSTTDQKPIIAWLTEHGIEPKFIPVNASFTFDGGSCTTQQYQHEDGRITTTAQVALTFDVRGPFPLSAEVTP